MLGIDIVSDGETSKISYATYVSDRYTGFAGDSPRQAPADLEKFPGFMQRLARAGGTPSYARPECVGEVRPKNHVELDRDIANLRAATAAHDARRAFMNAASPGVIALFQPNRFYPDRDAYIGALASAMKEEYERIVASGLDLQIDCPDLALARHMQFADSTEDEFVAIAARNVEALNHALRDIDSRSRSRPHLLGQLRGAARVRYRHRQGVFPADVNSVPPCALRGRQSASWTRVDGVS